MSLTILRVSHLSLPADLTFTQDELPQMVVRWVRTKTQRQETQTGDVVYNRYGGRHAIFELVFEIFRHGSDGTLEKLDLIESIGEPFTIYPFLARYPGSSFQVWWGDNELREEWVVGYPRAQFDEPIVWEQYTTGTCPQVLVS